MKTDGTSACWGLTEVMTIVPPAEEFIAVSTGDWHAWGLLANKVGVCGGEAGRAEATAPSKRSGSIGGARALHGSEIEGAFFGDYFATAPRRFVCRADGATVAALRGGRVCADSPASCGLRSVGDCFRARGVDGCRAPDGQRYAYPLAVGR